MKKFQNFIENFESLFLKKIEFSVAIEAHCQLGRELFLILCKFFCLGDDPFVPFASTHFKFVPPPRFLCDLPPMAKALSIMRYQDDINTEHNMQSIGRAAVAQWTKRLTRNVQTRVRIWKRRKYSFILNLLKCIFIQWSISELY